MLICTICLSFMGFGQKSSPVSWTFDIKKVSDSDYEITGIANIQKTWILYSQFTDDNGPIPTQFVINDKVVKFEEKSTSTKEHDEMFDVEVIKFKDEAVFMARVKKSDVGTCKGYVTYMTCDGARCLPPVDVNFDLKY